MHRAPKAARFERFGAIDQRRFRMTQRKELHMEAIQNLYRAETNLTPVVAVLLGYVFFAAVLISQFL